MATDTKSVVRYGMTQKCSEPELSEVLVRVTEQIAQKLIVIFHARPI